MITGMNVRFMTQEAIRPGVDREDAIARVDEMSEEEFRAFYDRTARRLWAYLSRITGEPQLADDLLQETYYRFVRAGSSYESEAHRRNALYRIATNLVHDAGRRRKGRHHVPLVEEGRPELPISATQADDVQRRTDLARAMQRLDPVQREMLWLAYAQGSSHEEIAKVLGLRTGSIRTLLYRARRRLAKLMSDWSPSEDVP